MLPMCDSPIVIGAAPVAMGRTPDRDGAAFPARAAEPMALRALAAVRRRASDPPGPSSILHPS